MDNEGRALLGYIDDYAGVANSKLQATQDCARLRNLLSELGVQESYHKATMPATTMSWIGLEYDSVAMEVRIPYDKITNITHMLWSWTTKYSATKRQLQQVLGKLLYIARCVKPARLFVSRMLDTLRAAPPHGYMVLSDEFHKDIAWFLAFLPSFNGVSIIQLEIPQTTAEIDSCLSGCGGICGSQHYHTIYPEFIMEEHLTICHLEMLNAVIAVKLWAAQWTNHAVTIYSDNAASVSVLTNGRARDPFLLKCVRKIWLLTARHNITDSRSQVGQ
jgi:hypothetical protein